MNQWWANLKSNLFDLPITVINVVRNDYYPVITVELFCWYFVNLKVESHDWVNNVIPEVEMTYVMMQTLCASPDSAYVPVAIHRPPESAVRTGHVMTCNTGWVLPYSLPSVGPGANPAVQAVSPKVTFWVISSGCRYFPPGLQSPSQPKNVTVFWPVPSYTA